jgi:hypothetical protein
VKARDKSLCEDSRKVLIKLPHQVKQSLCRQSEQVFLSSKDKPVADSRSRFSSTRPSGLSVREGVYPVMNDEAVDVDAPDS